MMIILRALYWYFGWDQMSTYKLAYHAEYGRSHCTYVNNVNKKRMPQKRKKAEKEKEKEKERRVFDR